MLRGAELDSKKFAPNKFSVKEGVYMQDLQRQVKREMVERNEKEVIMFDRIVAALKAETAIDDDEKLVEVKILNDRKMFKLILELTAEESGCSPNSIKAKRRYREQMIPKQVAIFLTRWLTRLPMKTIGREIVHGAGLDHSTIHYTCVKVTKAINIGEERIYPLLKKVIRRLRDNGVDMSLRKDFPEWYLKIVHKINS